MDQLFQLVASPSQKAAKARVQTHPFPGHTPRVDLSLMEAVLSNPQRIEQSIQAQQLAASPGQLLGAISQVPAEVANALLAPSVQLQQFLPTLPSQLGGALLRGSAETAKALLEPSFLPPPDRPLEVPDAGGAVGNALGDVLGALGRSALYQATGAGLANAALRIPAVAERMAQLAPIAQAAAKAALTGAGFTAAEQTSPEAPELSLSNLLGNIGLFAGQAVGGPVASEIVRELRPGTSQLAERALQAAGAGVGAAAGQLAGAATGSPHPLSALAENAVPAAINGLVAGAFDAAFGAKPVTSPATARDESMQAAADAANRAYAATQRNNVRGQRLAVADYWKAVRDAYHFARQNDPSLPPQMPKSARDEFARIITEATQPRMRFANADIVPAEPPRTYSAGPGIEQAEPPQSVAPPAAEPTLAPPPVAGSVAAPPPTPMLEAPGTRGRVIPMGGPPAVGQEAIAASGPRMQIRFVPSAEQAAAQSAPRRFVVPSRPTGTPPPSVRVKLAPYSSDVQAAPPEAPPQAAPEVPMPQVAPAQPEAQAAAAPQPVQPPVQPQAPLPSPAAAPSAAASTPPPEGLFGLNVGDKVRVKTVVAGKKLTVPATIRSIDTQQAKLQVTFGDGKKPTWISLADVQLPVKKKIAEAQPAAEPGAPVEAAAPEAPTLTKAEEAQPAPAPEPEPQAAPMQGLQAESLGMPQAGEMLEPKAQGAPGVLSQPTARQAKAQGADVVPSHPPIGEGSGLQVPVKRAEIIDFIEREFLAPVRKGRLFFKSSRGEYNLRQGVIRTRRPEDLIAIAHELGHHLSNTLGLGKYVADDPELQALGRKLYPNADSELATEEGIAEFFRHYFTAPDVAKAEAPKFYAIFDGRLREDPKLASKIEGLRTMYKQYWEQDPLERAKAVVVKQQIEERPWLSPADRAQAYLVDDLHPIYKAMKAAFESTGIKVQDEYSIPFELNAYLLGRLSRGRFRMAQVFFDGYQFDPQRRKVGESLRDILKPVAQHIDDFEGYLVAKRTVELGSRGIQGPMPVEVAEQAVQKAEAVHPEFKTTAAKLVEYQNHLVDHLVDAGVVSPEGAAAMRALNQEYAPFERLLGESPVDFGDTTRTAKPFVDIPQPIKKIEGSEASVLSPLQSIVKKTVVTFDVAERNRVARALFDAADASNLLGAIIERLPEGPADRDENIVTVWRNGQKEYYQVHPELYRSLKFLDQPVGGWLIDFLSLPTRVVRAGSVLSPNFIVRNPVRDQFTAAVQSRYGYVPFVDLARGLFHVLKRDDLYRLWEASGGAHSTMVSLSDKANEMTVKELLGDQEWPQRIKRLSPLRALEYLSMIIDEGTRVGEFARAIQKGADFRAAAEASRNVGTDFQRAGHYGRSINRFEAFFNAAIQGSTALVKAFRRDPLRATLFGLTYVTMPSILLWLRNRNDQRYRELPDWKRDTYWVIVPNNPSADLVLIPKPRELGMVFGSAIERMLDWAVANDPHAADGLLTDLQDAFSPASVWPPTQTAMDVMPDILLPIVEVWANKVAFTGAPVVPEREKDLLPEYQYGPETSLTARRIGAAFHVSPRQVETVVQGYTSTLGRDVLWLLDALQGKGEPMHAPVASAFTTPPYQSAKSVDIFYNEYGRLQKLYETYQQRQKAGEKATISPSDLAMYHRFDLAARQMSKLRAMERAAESSPSMTAEQKQQLKQKIDGMILNLARTTLGEPPIAAGQ